MPKKKREKDFSLEPWGAQTLFIYKVLGTNKGNIYVGFWSPKQIRVLSELWGITKAMKQYKIPAPWLETIVKVYMRLSKFEDGQAIKHSKDVAKGGKSYMTFNISRWKKIMGYEEFEES